MSNSSSLPKKKKSRDRKFYKVKDIETPPLASINISKKEKQSSEVPSQDEQFRLEKIIEKIIEKMLNKKFGTIIILLQLQNANSKISVNSKNDKILMILWK